VRSSLSSLFASNLGALAPSSLLALAAPLGGCPEPAGGTGGEYDGDSWNVSDDAGPQGECVQDAVQPCTCTSGQGSQRCGEDLRWGICECPDGIPVTPPPAPPESCKAGYYTGEFRGMYWPGIFDLGFGGLIGVDIQALGTPDKPGLAFTLKQKLVAEGGEFDPIYTVEDGCVVGTATAFGIDTHPFVALIKGELDCDTGVFTGTIDGYYDLFAAGELARFYFAGPVSAAYADPPQLTNGMWKVSEKQSTAANPPGGSGGWFANWKSAEGPGATLPECEALMNGGGTMNPGTDDPDAGI
jgi:hypothetical protein